MTLNVIKKQAGFYYKISLFILLSRVQRLLMGTVIKAVYLSICLMNWLVCIELTR